MKIKTFEELVDSCKDIPEIIDIEIGENEEFIFKIRYDGNHCCEYFVSYGILFLCFEPIREISDGGTIRVIHNISINSIRATYQGLYNMIKSIAECDFAVDFLKPIA